MSTNGSAAAPEQNNATPRLCHVKKVDTFDGYGFNLHAEHGKSGQYIGKVDDGSPADTAGLKEGDRILEVNGISIANDNHKQVVQKIKALPNETKLLVVTPGPGEKVPGLNTTTNGTAKKEETNNKSEAKKIVEEKPKNGVEESSSLKIKDNNGTSTLNNNGKSATTSPTEQMNKLNLTGMTVAEMREKLAQKKRVDPKKSAMDLKQKFEIVKKL